MKVLISCLSLLLLMVSSLHSSLVWCNEMKISPQQRHTSDRMNQSKAQNAIRITLVNGDIAYVDEHNDLPEVVLLDASSNEVEYRTIFKNDQLYVMPAAVVQYISAGFIDVEFFNISQLLRSSMTDDKSDVIPVLIKYYPNKKPINMPGMRVIRFFESTQTQFVFIQKSFADTIWEQLKINVDIQSIYLDTEIQAH